VATLTDDNAAYENWLHKRCDVVEVDLDAKHKRMRRSAFDFLRATYFRWAREIESVCPEVTDAPRLSCVGDVHVENFGTWRDADARLVWGVNDFDEAAVMPYTLDLVRLASSARLAPHLNIDHAEIATAILNGYRRGLADSRPALLDEHTNWLRPFASGGRNGNRKFWREVEGYPDARPPATVKHLLRKCLPSGAKVLRFASRTQGAGSLGRPRYLVIARWNSGYIVREAKAWVPSAWDWAHGKKGRRRRMIHLAYGEFRSPNPVLEIRADFVLGRLAPDSRKVEMEDIKRAGLGERLLAAMGADVAAIHAASGKRPQIEADLIARNAQWLRQAAVAAESFTRQDYKAFRALR
jgi:Uncharacterized protein conserved in bacteria (DUF2252)